MQFRDAATRRRWPVASSPLPPLPGRLLVLPGPSRHAASSRRLLKSSSRHTSYGRGACLKLHGPGAEEARIDRTQVNAKGRQIRVYAYLGVCHIGDHDAGDAETGIEDYSHNPRCPSGEQPATTQGGSLSWRVLCTRPLRCSFLVACSFSSGHHPGRLPSPECYGKRYGKEGCRNSRLDSLPLCSCLSGVSWEHKAMNLGSVTAHMSIAALGCASDPLWDGFYRLQVGPRKSGQCQGFSVSRGDQSGWRGGHGNCALDARGPRGGEVRRALHLWRSGSWFCGSRPGGPRTGQRARCPRGDERERKGEEHRVF
jgi:hypothetical protein